MSKGENIEPKHRHMAWAGIAGVAAGAALMIYVPSLKPISSTLFLFGGFHLVGLVVVLASLYVIRGRKLGFGRRFASVTNGNDAGFDFGWAPGWIYGPWIVALIQAAIAVVIQVAAPGYWPLAMGLTLLAASSFAGGLTTRSVGHYEEALLPAVDLLSGGDNLVLDAGCGAGRTTIALGRAFKKDRIVAFDRFDSSYIEGGGRRLLEKNLLLAGLSERVQIESGDLTAMPFPDQTFDAVVSAHAIDHLGAKAEQALREALRVLKPGGRLLLIVSVPGWTMFSVASVLSFFLSGKQAWRRMSANVGFALKDEGSFNGVWFALLERTGN